jgi:hypothetical protein
MRLDCATSVSNPDASLHISGRKTKHVG